MRLPIGTGSYLWRALKTVPTVYQVDAYLSSKGWEGTIVLPGSMPLPQDSPL